MNFMSVPWFLIIFCFLTIMYQTRLKYNDRVRKKTKTTEQMLMEETLSNFSRAKPIDDSMYISVDKSALPFGVIVNDSILETEEKINEILEKPVIHTGIQTNIEVKQRFGLKNLQTVIDGEENYEMLLKSLNTWAKLLLECGFLQEAESVLALAASIGSDISETYILLYDLYNESGDTKKSESLDAQIENLAEIAKQRVKNYIAAKNGDIENKEKQ